MVALYSSAFLSSYHPMCSFYVQAEFDVPLTIKASLVGKTAMLLCVCIELLLFHLAVNKDC